MRRNEMQTTLSTVIPEMRQGFSIKVNFCEISLDPGRESVKNFIAELQKELIQEINSNCVVPGHSY